MLKHRRLGRSGARTDATIAKIDVWTGATIAKIDVRTGATIARIDARTGVLLARVARVARARISKRSEQKALDQGQMFAAY